MHCYFTKFCIVFAITYVNNKCIGNKSNVRLESLLSIFFLNKMWLFLDIKMFNVEKMSNMKNGRPNKATNHLYSVLAGRSNHLKRVKCLNINIIHTKTVSTSYIQKKDWQPSPLKDILQSKKRLNLDFYLQSFQPNEKF